MSQDITTIGLAVDTSGVKAANTELDKFSATGAKVESATDRIEAGLKQVGTASQAAAANFALLTTEQGRNTASARILEGIRVAQQASLKGQYDAQQKFIASLKDEADAVGKTRAELMAMKAAQLGVSDSAAPLIARLTAANKVNASFAAGNKMSAFQAQQLSFQLNDLFVQIASGASPLIALIQQGSQLSGTFGGIRGALAAVASTLTGTVLTVGATAASFAALAYAYYEGGQRSKSFSDAIRLTGNAAGLTEGQFNSLTETVAKFTGTSMGAAREALQAFVSTGQFSGDALTKSTEAALLFSKASGQSIEDVVKQFATLADSPSRAVEALNKKMNLLNADQTKYVKTLEDQGDSQKAVIVVMDALNARLKTGGEKAGTAEKALIALKDAFDSLSGKAGSTITFDDQITKITARIQAETAKLNALQSPSINAPQVNPAESESVIKARIAGLQKELEQRQALKKAKEDEAKETSDSANREKDKTEYLKLQEASMTRQQRLAKAIADANAKMDKAGVSEADRKPVLASIREQFDPGIDTSKSGSAIAVIQRQLEQLNTAYSASESILEATRQAGLMSEQEYYDAKSGFIKLDQAAQVSAMLAENAVIERSNQNIRLTTAERIANGSKIADNLAKIDGINTKAAASTAILGVQQQSASAAMAKAFEQARQSASDYLRTLYRAQQQELDMLGMGTAARQQAQGRNQISNRYDDERRRIQNERALLETQQKGSLTSDQEKRFSDQLALQDEFEKKALASYDDYTAQKTNSDKRWQVGASEAMANYLNEANNTAKLVETFYTNSLSSIEDSLVSFVTTGKLNFSSLANSIIADLVRIQIKQSLANVVSNYGSYLTQAGSYLFGGDGSSSASSTVSSQYSLDTSGVRLGKAIGGTVSSGGMYPVIEKGTPEVAKLNGKSYLLTGDTSGTVTPASGATGQQANFTFNIGSGVTRNELAAMLPELKKQWAAEYTAQQRRTSVMGGGVS